MTLSRRAFVAMLSGLFAVRQASGAYHPPNVFTIGDRLHFLDSKNQCLVHLDDLSLLLADIRRYGCGYGVELVEGKPWVRVTVCL